MLANLKAALAARKIKQLELAAELRVSPSVVTDIVLGRREVDAETRAKIAALLGVENQAWLFQRAIVPRSVRDVEHTPSPVLAAG